MKNKNEDNRFDVIISGGGIPGLATAIILAQSGRGLRVAVIEPAPAQPLQVCAKDYATTPDGRTAALMQQSLAQIIKTGIWETCAPYGALLRTLRIIDEGTGRRTGNIQVDFHADEIGLDSFGFNMPNNILRAALYDRARTCDSITLYEGSSLQHMTADDFTMRVTLTNGQTIAAHLLIGADGRRSTVREQAGIKCQTTDHKQHAITCVIDHGRGHNNTSIEFHRPGGPFTLVPLPGNRSSVVWVEYNDDANKYMRLSRPAFEHALQDRTGNMLGAVSLCSTPQAWPLQSSHAETLVAPRVMLMAEAAHVLHPIGAQGLNLSLRDVSAAIEIILDAHSLGLDYGALSVLRRYESLRRHDVMTRRMGTDGFNRLVSNDKGFARKMRRAGLRTLNGFSPLKQLAMQQGLA